MNNLGETVKDDESFAATLTGGWLMGPFTSTSCTYKVSFIVVQELSENIIEKAVIILK
jgi:hypothetical protein